MPTPTLRLGTRASLLARAQSATVAADLRAAHPGLIVEEVLVTTTGDRVTDRPLADIGGKGLFIRELEIALLDGRIDFAVHSLKDVPVTMPLVDQTGLVLAAIPPRADPRDALVTAADAPADLPHGARVGTSSLRRRCQLLATRPDLRIEPLRGNVDTRVGRVLGAERLDAVVLAMAGLARAGLADRRDVRITPLATMLPAAGQGALALQCRAADTATRRLLEALEHPPTRRAITQERAIVAGLDGDCHSPIAAWHDGTQLRAAIAAAGGNPPLLTATGPDADDVLRQLLAAGAHSMLHR